MRARQNYLVFRQFVSRTSQNNILGPINTHKCNVNTFCLVQEKLENQ